MQEQLGAKGRWRVLTDLSGPFDTVIQVVEMGSLADWERARAKLFGLPAFRVSMGRKCLLSSIRRSHSGGAPMTVPGRV